MNKNQAWKAKAREIQRQLDREHSMRDHNNALYNTDYTTKQALELVKRK